MTNFWQALEQADQITPVESVEYRLYYDLDSGAPLFYTMQDETGNYIVIDQETYTQSRYDIQVKDGKIKKNTLESTGKLAPAEAGTRTHNTDITIITTDEQSTQWKLKTYESN